MYHRIQFLVKSLKNWKVRLIRLYLYKTSMHSSIKCWKWNGKKSSLEKAKNVQKRHFSWNWIRWRRTDRYWFIILILSSIKDDDKKISFVSLLFKKSCTWAKTKHKTDLFSDFFSLWKISLWKEWNSFDIRPLLAFFWNVSHPLFRVYGFVG